MTISYIDTLITEIVNKLIAGGLDAQVYRGETSQPNEFPLAIGKWYAGVSNIENAGELSSALTLSVNITISTIANVYYKDTSNSYFQGIEKMISLLHNEQFPSTLGTGKLYYESTEITPTNDDSTSTVIVTNHFTFIKIIKGD